MNNNTSDNSTSNKEAITHPAAPAKTGYADVNGLKMYYEIYGAGKPIVLIHGGGSTIQTSFGRLIPFLSKHRQVIGVELQAHGHTGDRNTALSFEQDADDVAMLLQNMGIASADIMGFSNGGNTAMQIAIRHPEKVNRLIVASSFYKKEGMHPDFWKAMSKAQFSDMPQVYKDAYLQITNDSARLMNMFNRDVFRMQHFTDWSDNDLRAIQAPTLVLLGDQEVVMSEHAVLMSRIIPHAQLAILPGGHGKYMGEITTLVNGKWTQEYVATLLEDFLDGGKK